MEAGSLRAQLAHDNDAKEEEISTLRDTLNKRISSLQDQLEEEYATSKTALKVHHWSRYFSFLLLHVISSVPC